MVLIIDRFEGELAVCEDENRKMINIKRSKIPEEAKEGDVLNYDEDIITIDYGKTQKRTQYIKKLSDGIWE